jgi:hypothetical protein
MQAFAELTHSSKDPLTTNTEQPGAPRFPQWRLAEAMRLTL